MDLTEVMMSALKDAGRFFVKDAGDIPASENMEIPDTG
jgi:hypothetical protein